MPFLKKSARPVLVPLVVGVATLAGTAAILSAVRPAYEAASGVSTRVSGSSSSAVAELSIGRVREIERWEDVSLPVDAYRPRQSDQNRVVTALYQYTRQCAARYGVEFDVAAPVLPPTEVSRDYYRLFGLIDLRSAQSYGYHSGENISADGQGTPHVEPPASAPNFWAVVAGDPDRGIVDGQSVPSGGCFGEARRRIGDTEKIQGLFERAIGYAMGQADQDTRVLEAFAARSACMGNSGYSYSTPMQANNDSRWTTTLASSAEIATAVADVGCKSSTGLTSLRVAVTAAWTERYIQDNSSAFAAVAPYFDKQLSTANKVLSESTTGE